MWTSGGSTNSNHHYRGCTKLQGTSQQMLIIIIIVVFFFCFVLFFFFILTQMLSFSSHHHHLAQSTGWLSASSSNVHTGASICANMHGSTLQNTSCKQNAFDKNSLCLNTWTHSLWMWFFVDCQSVWHHEDWWLISTTLANQTHTHLHTCTNSYVKQHTWRRL